MQQVEADFERALRILDPPRPFALAVSGGPDSTALMRLAAALKPVVITVDHGLRADSGLEVEKVAGWAQGLGLRHAALHWSGEKPASGIQAAAREARYRLMAEACMRAGAASLLTGHTLDDQIETVAMRQSKGSGALGAAGMASQTLLPATGGAVRLARPLLATRKAALGAMLERMGQDFVVDPSNSDPRFDRGRMRAGPPQAVTVGEIVRAQKRRLVLEGEALRFLTSMSTLAPDGSVLIPRGPLAALSQEPGDLVLGTVLRRVGGLSYPGTRAERSRVLEAIQAKVPFGGRTLAGCIMRRATRAEAGPGVDAIVFAAEREDAPGAGGWWLPFAQYPQLGPAGEALTVA